MKYHNNELYTPFYNALVKIGDTYYSDIYIEDNFYINKALHSFKNYNDTKQVLKYYKDQKLFNFILKDAKIVKCIIPKNSIYYEGFAQGLLRYEDSKNIIDLQAIASNTLKYVEIIKD